jgi:hypothetical protein
MPRHSFTGIHVGGCLGDSPDSFRSNPILSPPPAVVHETFSSGRLPSSPVQLILERSDTASLWVSRSYRIGAPVARSELDQPGLDDLSSGKLH